MDVGSPSSSRTRRHPRWRGRASTLIELLVVIAVLAILASLLLPAIASARQKARSMRCLSNVKQWTLAVALYVQDYDEFFRYEGRFAPLGHPSNSNAWFNLLARDVVGEIALADRAAAGWVPLPTSSTIFSCPSGTNPPATTNSGYGYFMYGFNNRLDPNESTSWGKRDPHGQRAFQMGDVLRPSVTPVFTENSEGAFPSTGGRYTAARHRWEPARWAGRNWSCSWPAVTDGLRPGLRCFGAAPVRGR